MASLITALQGEIDQDQVDSLSLAVMELLESRSYRGKYRRAYESGGFTALVTLLEEEAKCLSERSDEVAR